MNRETFVQIKPQYRDKSVAQLTNIARRHFNAWIRKRDAGKPCINCGKYRTLEAGHFFAAGHFSSLRFNEHNVNGECKQCNYYDSQSHAHKYKPNLINKIGKEAFERLEFLAAAQKRHLHKWDKFSLIEIIEKYKN